MARVDVPATKAEVTVKFTIEGAKALRCQDVRTQESLQSLDKRWSSSDSLQTARQKRTAVMLCNWQAIQWSADCN